VKATVISSRGATKEEAQDQQVWRCWGSEQNQFRTFKVIQRSQRQCRWSLTCSPGDSFKAWPAWLQHCSLWHFTRCYNLHLD
jgi:hypothetical protein